MSNLEHLEKEYLMNLKDKAMSWPNAAVGSMYPVPPDEYEAMVYATKPVGRLEQAVHRVQALREILANWRGVLTSVSSEIVGPWPFSDATPRPEDPPNGMLHALHGNLDTLEREIAELGEVIERLREGV